MNIEMMNGFLAESMYRNYLRESGILLKEDNGDTTGEISLFAPLILPLVQKIYPDSLVGQIASIQPSTSPIAKVAALYSYYAAQSETGDTPYNLIMDNSWIISVPAQVANSIPVGSKGTSGANEFTVYYTENSEQFATTFGQAGPFSPGAELTRGFPDKYTHLLIGIDSGVVHTGDTFTIAGIAGLTLKYVSSNRNVIRRVFADYSKVLESNSNLQQVNFEVRTSTIQCSTRKILSKFSPEMLQDYLAIYKEKGYDLVAKFIASEISHEIDREIVAYMKNIATPMPIDVDLTQSIAKTGADLSGMTQDIFCAIFLAIEEIVRATKRNRTMFILADSTTCAFMSLNALQTDVEPSESNPYLVGKIGPYPLFCDPFSTENYVLVGYKFDSDSKDDAGLIYSPYTTEIVEVPDAKNFATNFLTLNRYGYIRHPQDTGTGIGDSDFFRYFAVNYYDAFSPIANLGNQIRAFV